MIIDKNLFAYCTAVPKVV